MASWNNQPQSATGGRPSANPIGGSLTKDDIQIKRLSPKAADPSSLIKAAFEFVKQHPLEVAVVPIGVMVILSIANQVISMIVNIAAAAIGQALANAVGGDAGQALSMGLTVVTSMGVSIVAQVIMAALMGGINIMWLRIIRGQTVSINDMIAIKSFVLPLILTSILSQIAIMFGFVFLFVPGVLLALGLGMVQYIVIDKNLKYVDALKASWELMDGHKMEFFIFGIILFFLNVAGMLAFCVGMLLTYSISIGAMAMFYDAIAEPGNAYGNNLGNAPDVFS